MHNPIKNTESQSQIDVNGGKCLFAMILLSAVGNSVLVVQPLTVGAMVDLLGFSDRQAGLVAFGELGGFSLGSLLMSTLVHRFNRHHLAYAGIALVIAGNVLALIPDHFLPFFLIRAIAGVGCAMPIASFIGTAVRTKVPDRTFGVVNATSIAYSGILLMIAPSLIEYGGLKIIYLMLAIAAALFALVVHWIPPMPLAAVSGAQAEKDLEQSNQYGAGRRTIVLMWVLVLIVMLCLYTGHGAIWAYQERIGFSLGLDKHYIGVALGVAMIVGIVGSLIPWVAGLAIGRVWPQVISLALSIVAAIFLITGKTLIAFGMASSLITFTWFYGLPYQMGLLAKLDPKGRANVAGVVMTTGGAALGPAIAAMIISPGNFSIIGWFAAMCYTICLIFVLPPAIMLDRWDKQRVIEPAS